MYGNRGEAAGAGSVRASSRQGLSKDGEEGGSVAPLNYSIPG